MTAPEPVRFEEGRAMLLAGLRRVHPFDGAAEGIAAQWRELRRLGMIPGRQGTAAYGVLCGADLAARTMEYMAGVEVATFEGLSGDYGRMRVPAQRYAVFVHGGPAATVQATWDAIWNGWMPHSGCEPAHTPEFEVYDARFDPRTGSGVIEIWASIRETAG